tara:strand:+ start:4508 stop:5140 length:633 start_codon:yes stop_codon:yes gene_type:complete
VKVTVTISRKKVLTNKRGKSLVMVSGGLDSVAALVWLLENTDDLIHVHHVRLFNYEDRSTPEYEAYKNCMKYIEENYRPLHLVTESVVSWPEPFCPWDMYSYMFQGALLINCYNPGFNPTRIVTGSIDEEDPNTNVHVRRGVSWEMFKLLCEHAVEWYKPLLHMKKPEVAAILPDELRRMTFSCRSPIVEDGIYRSCGECRPCWARRKED